MMAASMETKSGVGISNETMQESLHDESYLGKRDASNVDDAASKAAKKKRRSSLCSRRRSIIREEGQASEVTSSESGSQGSLPSSSEGKNSQADQENVHVNPINQKLNEVISQMENKISSLKGESARWKEMEKELREREEETRLLASNLILPSSDVPDISKEMALTRYITCRPLDLSAVATKVQDLLAMCQFNREACVQDLRLLADSMDSLHSAAEMKATLMVDTCLSLLGTETVTDVSMDLSDADIKNDTDIKNVVQNIIDH